MGEFAFWVLVKCNVRTVVSLLPFWHHHHHSHHPPPQPAFSGNGGGGFLSILPFAAEPRGYFSSFFLLSLSLYLFLSFFLGFLYLGLSSLMFGSDTGVRKNQAELGPARLQPFLFSPFFVQWGIQLTMFVGFFWPSRQAFLLGLALLSRRRVSEKPGLPESEQVRFFYSFSPFITVDKGKFSLSQWHVVVLDIPNDSKRTYWSNGYRK